MLWHKTTNVKFPHIQCLSRILVIQTEARDSLNHARTNYHKNYRKTRMLLQAIVADRTVWLAWKDNKEEKKQPIMKGTSSDSYVPGHYICSNCFSISWFFSCWCEKHLQHGASSFVSISDMYWIWNCDPTLWFKCHIVRTKHFQWGSILASS